MCRYAMKICFGAYVGLFIMQTIKQSIKNTPEVRTVDTAMTHTFCQHSHTHSSFFCPFD